MSKDDLYKIFIRWYVQPYSTREPKDVKDFAIQNNLKPKDIVDFTERDTYYDDIYKEAQNWGKSKIPELLTTLYEEFKVNKKSETLRVYKELLQLNDKSGSNITINVLNPSDATYRKIVEREARLLENSSEQSSNELLPVGES